MVGEKGEEETGEGRREKGGTKQGGEQTGYPWENLHSLGRAGKEERVGKESEG